MRIGQFAFRANTIIFFLLIFTLFSVSVYANVVCQYATSATATSEQSGAEAIFATGQKDADGECTGWSGYSKTWSPMSQLQSNLTLSYTNMVSATNITIFADYDVCYDGIWIRNSRNGSELRLLNQAETSCEIKISVPKTFNADTIIIQSCQDHWSSTDAALLCGNPVTADPKPVCGNSKVEYGEDCDDGNTLNDDGCSSICKDEIIYVAPYIGDFDGNINSEWFYVYKQLIDWHKNQSVPLGITFYASTLDNDDFRNLLGEFTTNDYVELIMKGEPEVNGVELNRMTKTQVKNIIDKWDKAFVGNMSIAGYNVSVPQSYNQQLGLFTKNIRDATRELGYHIYFEQYLTELGPTDSLSDYDVMQYSVSFTTDGQAGPDTKYKTTAQILDEVNKFTHTNLAYINGSKVVTIYASQQDFRISDDSDEINQTKWNTYQQVYNSLKNNKRIRFVKPMDIYNLRHQVNSSSQCTSQNCKVIFRTNIPSGKYFDCTNTRTCWIASDINGDGQLDSLGFDGKSTACKKTGITIVGKTPEGFDVYTYGATGKLAICDSGKRETRYFSGRRVSNCELSSSATEPYTTKRQEVLANI